MLQSFRSAMLVFSSFFALHLCLVSRCAAQIDAPPPARVQHLTHGVNVGRLLDGEFKDDFYQCCKEDDRNGVHFVRDIKAMGFDHIRVLVQPGKMFELSKRRADFGPSLKVLDDLVLSCVNEDVGIILAITLDEFKDKLGSDDFDTQLAAFWKNLAGHYSDYSKYKPGLVFFEVLNEPGSNEKSLTDAQWAEIQATLVKAIRDSASQNTILVTGAENSDIQGLLALHPLGIGNVIYLFHYYEPYSFTHQGETWESTSYVHFLQGGVRYPYAPESAKEVVSQVKDLQQRLYAWLDMQSATKNRFEADIEVIDEWARAQNLTVICDEFGVYRQYSDPGDRAAWVHDVRQLLEEHGIGWTFWDYSSVNFGVFSATSPPDRGIITALGRNYPLPGK